MRAVPTALCQARTPTPAPRAIDGEREATDWEKESFERPAGAQTNEVRTIGAIVGSSFALKAAQGLIGGRRDLISVP